MLAIALSLGACTAATARAAYVIEQREGNNVSSLTLAGSGLRFDGPVPVPAGASRGRARVRPLSAMIIRYRDARLLVLDLQHRRYQMLALASAISSYEAELRAAQRAQPSVQLPPRPGAAPVNGQAPLTPPPARLQRLALSARIGPVRARAYLLRQGSLRERLWYADALPRPPARIRGLLVGALGGSAAGPLGRALSAHAAQIPLRIDVASGNSWRTTLRTTRLARRALGAHALDTPRGYTGSKLLPSPGASRAHAADVPARPIRCGIAVVDVLGCLTGFGPLVGPVSDHPAIFAFYWGRRFAARTDYVSSINQALHDFVGDEFAGPGSRDFWGPLDQYGVHQGRLLGYKIVNQKPDDSVGSWNFFDVQWFVLTQRWRSDAPSYWWRFSDQDPIFAIFVDQNEVNASGWGGYHFFTPTEGVLFSFLVHPAMPWFIVKVPSPDSVSLDHASAAYHQAVDAATTRASHEFVEAATDPYPFVSWADPLKLPIWEQGEIGDICQQGNTSPWGKATRVSKSGPALSPFWSNGAHACVPDARPSAQIFSPSNGDTFSWRAPVSLGVRTDDLYDGGPVRDIRWYSDLSGPLGVGAFPTTTNLRPGTQRIFVDVRDSQGGTRTAGPVTVNVVVHPPNVRIDRPANGATFGSDETVNYRGVAFDPQQGDLGASATWSVDGTPVGAGASLFQYRIPTQGVHTVTLSVTNGAGASSSASITVTVGPPTGRPSVQITSPAPGSSFAAGSQITFTASATTQGGATLPESGYSWRDDVDGVLGAGHTITHSLSGSPCEIITHHVTATVTDSFSRSASDTITVSVGGIC